MFSCPADGMGLTVRRIGANVMQTMKAVVFHGVGDLRVQDVPRPRPNAGEAVIRITATTICGTDVHIVKGEYPVKQGLILGHEPVGVIHELALYPQGIPSSERVRTEAVGAIL
jgi:D-arabinose 1-dehydrogenase-like Zn-dependent alcohol dehydrogenase